MRLNIKKAEDTTTVNSVKTAKRVRTDYARKEYKRILWKLEPKGGGTWDA